MMIHRPLLLLFTLLKYVFSLQLDEALLFDMFPQPSAACLSQHEIDPDETQTSYTFTHSASESSWHQNAEPYEEQNFLAEMTSASNDSDRSWKIRIGQSGNMYSLRGVYGEAVPPQFHSKGEFVDEVNQLVAVNQVKNNDSGSGPYFIHQSGVYRKDGDFTNNNPFFSPSIAKVCKDRTCAFASWGQQAHLPTSHSGVALYYTMYTDCGNGVIEFSQIIHNTAKNGDDLTYLNTPWGGPRTSSLRSYVQAKDDKLNHMFPLDDWGSPAGDAAIRNLGALDGFTIFAENLRLPEDQLSFDLPVVNGQTIQLVVANKSTHTTYMSWHTSQWGAYCVRTELKTTGATGAGCNTCYLSFISADETGEDGNGGIVTRVLHWSWDGKWLYHFPIDKTAWQVNNLLNQNTEIIVSWAQDGKEPADNLALGHVFGFQTNLSKRLAASRVRYGSTTPGREYLAYTVNARVDIDPGDTYLYRQYFISGKYESVANEATQWTEEAYDDLYGPGEMVGRDIELYSDDSNSFAVIVAPDPCHQGELRCTGKSVPGFGLDPLFFITCGDNTYVGSDQYHFAPSRASVNDVIRAYACDGEDPTVRPTLKLLGYFVDGSCAFLQDANEILDSNAFCTQNPTSNPSSVPSAPSVSINPSISIAPTERVCPEICPAGSTGYQASCDCSGYHNCAYHDKNYIFSCGPGLKFDQGLLTCVLESQVQCDHDPPSTSAAPSSSSTCPEICPAGSTGKQPSCDCSGYHDCNYYDKNHIFLCGAETKFDKHGQVCVWEDLVDCECPDFCDPNGPVLQPIKDCLGYVYCTGSQSGIHQCPQGEIFRVEDQGCLPPESHGYTPQNEYICSGVYRGTCNRSTSPSMSSSPSISTEPSVSDSPSVSSAPSVSESPSISTSPSISYSPSVSSAPSVSSSPSISTAPSVSDSPSLSSARDKPSLAPSFPTWEIANATFADYLNQQTSYLTLEHVIGTANSDLEVTLYEYDCETEVETDAALSFANEGISGRKASYDVVLARESVGSSVFLKGGDELQFCVGAALHVPNDTNGWGSIVSKKTKIAIAFDLANAQFFVITFETQGENPDDFNIEADDRFYEMEACICSNSFTCDSLNGVVAAQQENSVVFICLKPPTGLNFEGYNMIFSKGDVEPGQSDFSYDAIGAPFTSEEKEGNMIRVRTQLLSGLFDVGEDGLARVSGIGTFVFDTNAKDGEEEDVEGSYKMFVGLQEVEECEPSLVDLLKNTLGL